MVRIFKNYIPLFIFFLSLSVRFEHIGTGEIVDVFLSINDVWYDSIRFFYTWFVINGINHDCDLQSFQMEALKRQNSTFYTRIHFLLNVVR